MEKTASLSYKPHFFQPILPGSSSAHFLPIPKAFKRDYLVNGEDSEGIATLKSPLKSWKVKLNGFKLTDGWEEFFKAHNLSMGNFLVFQYEGHDLIFDVWVFDSSYCEVEYSLPTLMPHENEMYHGHQMCTAEGLNRESKAKGKKRETFADNFEVEDDSEKSHDDEELEEVDEGGTSLSISKYPYFITTLKRYNIGRSFLAIPNEFSKAKIPNDVQSLVLKDEEGRKWPIKLIRRKDWYGVMFGCGWYGFQSEMGLKIGDICLFEQEDEDKMEFTVSIVTK